MIKLTINKKTVDMLKTYSVIKLKILILFFVSIFLITCTEPEPDLKLSPGEAFGFDLGDSWEVNASVIVQGFKQKEIGDDYSIFLSYSVDLITPGKDSIMSAYNDSIEETSYEEFMDFILEAQLEVDNKFGEGDYKTIFNVKDEYSGQVKSIAVDFKLSK